MAESQGLGQWHPLSFNPSHNGVYAHQQGNPRTHASPGDVATLVRWPPCFHLRHMQPNLTSDGPILDILDKSARVKYILKWKGQPLTLNGVIFTSSLYNEAALGCRAYWISIMPQNILCLPHHFFWGPFQKPIYPWLFCPYSYLIPPWYYLIKI